MPGIFLSLLKNWRVILPLLAALLIGGFILYQHVKLQNLSRERDDLRLELSMAQANLEAIQRVSKAEKAALLKNQKSERENDADQRLLREKAAVVGPDRDGPIAPVLFDAISGLQLRAKD